jgi:colicin import membrane protein
MNNLSRHKEGLITTLAFHLILLFLLFRAGLFTPLPVLEEKGMIVDFGMTDEGMGLTEPTPKESAPAEPATTKASPPAPKQREEKQEIVTQDYEETAVIREAKKKLNEQKHKEILEKQLSDNRKRDSLQKINNERIAELNRIAEIRRQDSLKNAAEQASINQINSRAKNAFGSGVSGMGTDPNSTGQGNSNKPGNQGSPDGVAGGGYGDGTGTGYGNGKGKGTGVSFSLKGRVAKSYLKPSYPGNEDGVVVVEVTVDKSGKVTKATPGVKGTNTLNSALMEAARKAAMSTKFSENSDAPEIQTGTITYHFVLN